MTRLRPALLVGLLGLGGAGAFILLYGRVERVVVKPGEGYRVYADFPDASGLASNSRVTMAGIPVGVIDSIRLVMTRQGEAMARVYVRIKPSVTLWSGERRPDGTLVNAATITRRSATILGDYLLEVTPGSAGRPLKEGDRIPVVVGEAGLMALAHQMERLQDIVPYMERTARNLAVITDSLASALGGKAGSRTVKGIADQLAKTSENLALITSQIRDFVEREGAQGGRVDRVLTNIERFSGTLAALSAIPPASLKRSVENIEAVTAALRKIVAGEPQASRQGELKSLLRKLDRALTHLTEATKDLAEIAHKVNSGQGTIGRLVSDDTLVKKTEKMVSDVGDLVNRVSNLNLNVGFRSEYNFYARAVKNYLSLRLQPSHDKYYLVQLVFDPRGKTNVTERVTLTTDPTKNPAVYEHISETSADLKLSLEFARRYSFLTGRFGLIESTGGLGMDLQFLRDSLKFSFDLFDFSADRFPRLRALLTFRFLEHFYVSAGADDLFNPAGRDYFVGAGFSFTDKDLLTFLLVTPSSGF